MTSPPWRIAIPGRNVVGSRLSARTAMPMPRTNSTSLAVNGSANIGLRRLRERVLGLGKSPVEPLRERFDVACFNGRAAPHAQARWRIAIGVDVVGDAFLLERCGEVLDEGRLRIGREREYGRVDDLEAHRGVRAHGRIAGEKRDPRR